MESEGLYPRFSEAEFARRYAAVRAGMQEADLPVLVVYGTPPFASSEVQYLANFPVTREAFLVFPGELCFRARESLRCSYNSITISLQLAK